MKQKELVIIGRWFNGFSLWRGNKTNKFALLATSVKQKSNALKGDKF